MLETRCPQCSATLALSERRFVVWAADGETPAQVLFSCLMCAYDAVLTVPIVPRSHMPRPRDGSPGAATTSPEL